MTPQQCALMTIEEQHQALTLLRMYYEHSCYDSDPIPNAETAALLSRFTPHESWSRCADGDE